MKSMMNSKLKTLLAVILMASASVGLSACNPKAGGAKPGAKGKAAEVKAPPSPYAAIANGKVDVEGGVIAVAARRAGIISEVFAHEGDEVKKGQILARLEVEDTQLAVNSARAAVSEAESQMAVTRVNLTTAQREYDRLAKLAPQNFVAQQRLDTAQDQIAQAQAQLEAQSAAVTSARARLAQSQYNVEQTYVRSPVDGKIVRSYANPGAGTSTLNVTSLYTLEPHVPHIVRAEIIENSIPDVKIDQEVELIPEADQTKVFVGHVLRISPIFGARKLNSDDGNQATDERVVEVVVTADNTPFLIGQRVLVKFMKPGQKAGIKREVPKVVTPKKK
jgi:HlyD family secretion protein